MKNNCCVCGNRAEGLIVYGEFVCYTCHEEATGERPEPKSFDGKLAAHGVKKRRRVQDALIADRLRNVERGHC